MLSFHRDSAVSSAAAAERAKKEVVADYDSRREQLEQDRLELEASIREKEVKLEWAIEEERNNAVILKQRYESLRIVSSVGARTHVYTFPTHTLREMTSSHVRQIVSLPIHMCACMCADLPLYHVPPYLG